jgi:hypothetical protein
MPAWGRWVMKGGVTHQVRDLANKVAAKVDAVTG